MKKNAVLSVFITVAFFFLSGCTHQESEKSTSDVEDISEEDYEASQDPFEPVNRVFLAFNMILDTVILKPLTFFYAYALPPAIKTGLTNFKDNLSSPFSCINDLLQGEWELAHRSLTRFLINSTYGLGGFFNVTSYFGDIPHQNNFSRTLYQYGFRVQGPYLVLPFLGVTTLRSLVDEMLNYAINPVNIALRYNGYGWVYTGAKTIQYMNTRAFVLQNMEYLQYQVDDLYVLVRSIYLQREKNYVEADFIQLDQDGK